MRKYVLTFVAIMFAFPFWAQMPFTMSPNDTIETEIPSNAYTELMIEQINTTGEALSLGVEVIQNDVPESWDGMVCLQGVCLGIIPPVGTTSQMMAISGSTNGYVRLTANPLGNTETATLRIRVYDIANPSDFELATWIVHSSPLGLGEIGNSTGIETYPNPATDFVNISSDDNFDQINIYGMDGKLVLHEILPESTTQQISISHLSAGIYMLEILKESTPIATHKIVRDE